MKLGIPKNNVHLNIKFGVISDTHIPARAKKIPDKIFEVFKGVSLIIHAGDLTQLNVLGQLEQVAPVVAIYGNMDKADVRARLPEIDSVEVYDWKIGVIHDPGVLWGTRQMKKIAKQNNFDVLVFGHTHRPSIKHIEGILFINPGSPTNPIPPFLVKPSVALLRVKKEKIDPEIVKL